MSTVNTSSSFKNWASGIYVFSPNKNEADIAVEYIDSPKIRKTNIPCRLPLKTSFPDERKEVINANGNKNVIIYQSVKIFLSPYQTFGRKNALF